MSGGIDPGRVRLRLGIAAGRVAVVEVGSERPDLAPVLRGRPAAEAVRLVPLLFALCGKAQGRAAELALAAARGAECAAHLDPRIEQEVMREHLWRWLLDLPPLLGAAPLQAEFATVVAAIGAGRRGELVALLADLRIEDLCRRLLASDAAAGGHAALLPALAAHDTLAAWPRLDAAFCRAPHWLGAAAETGAIARRPQLTAPGAFAARWMARLEELRDWSAGCEKVGAGGTASAVRSGPGRGRALVETARGLLLHEIALDGERIAEYFIVAPTEWNFHPQGPLAGWLTGREAGNREQLQAFAARAVAALDPCVRWELEWL